MIEMRTLNDIFNSEATFLSFIWELRIADSIPDRDKRSERVSHVRTLYCLPLYFCFGLEWKLAVVFFSHLLIDTLKAYYQKISYTADQVLHYCVLCIYIIF